ncbi:MAG: PilN domain-containing protein [Pseudomonadales bacterium]
MRQQINLLKSELQDQKPPLDAVSMAGIGVLVLALMSGWSGYSWWQVRTLEAQQVSTQKQLERMRQDVARLQEKQQATSPSQLLESELRRAREELERRRQIVDRLSGGTFRNTEGFSALFESLARQHAEGAWLTDISVSKGGSFVSLEGETNTAELVPAYLERLMKEKAFSQVSFNTLELNVSEQEVSRLSFKVATGSGGSAGDESS